MYDIFKTLSGAIKYLHPHVVPSYKNLSRTIAFISSSFLMPTITMVVPYIFLRQGEEVKRENINTDITINLTFVTTIAMLHGLQQGIAIMLQASTMQAMRKKNMAKLIDNNANFLIYGSDEKIKSIQYVTVGEGVKQFTINAVPMFTLLPNSIISACTTVVYIGVFTESLTTVGAVLGLAASSFFGTYSVFKLYTNYQVHNQKLENELVGKVNFIEANRGAIVLTGAIDKESEFVEQRFKEIDKNIVKLPVACLLYFFLASFC